MKANQIRNEDNVILERRRGFEYRPWVLSCAPEEAPMASAIRFCSAADGSKIAYAALTRRHTLICHDLRGFGLSDRNPVAMSLDAWVSDLEAAVNHAGLGRFPMFAVCQGGPMAIELAARHPDLGLSEKTVKNHITSVAKLGVENRPQAIVKARSAGLAVC